MALGLCSTYFFLLLLISFFYDGRMTCDFTSISTGFQSDVRAIMKGYVQ